MHSSRLAAFLPFSSVFSASYRTSPPDYLEFPSSVSGLHIPHGLLLDLSFCCRYGGN